MIAVVTASCVTAYAFYTTAAETRDKYQTDKLAWTLPFVLYGIFRYLYLVHQKEKGGSPTDILLADRPLLVDVAPEEKLALSVRNIAGIRFVPSNRVTTRDVMDATRIIATRSALERLQEVLA